MNNALKNIIPENLYNDIQCIAKNKSSLSLFKDKTVMIVGACSQIGYYMVCGLLLCNDNLSFNTKIIATNGNSKVFKALEKFSSREDLEFFATEDFSNIQYDTVDIIIHTDPKYSQNNLKTICSLLDFAKEKSVKSILISTDYNIYGSVYNGTYPLKEQDMGYLDTTTELGYYAQNQRMAESVAKDFSRLHSIPVKIARLSDVFSGINNQNPLYPIFCNIITNNNITFTKDDYKIKSYCYVTDCVSAIIAILNDNSSDVVYNISSDITACPQEIAQTTADICKDYKGNLIVKNGKTHPSYTPMCETPKVLDNAKLTHIGYKPCMNLKDGIAVSVSIIKEQL